MDRALSRQAEELTKLQRHVQYVEGKLDKEKSASARVAEQKVRPRGAAGHNSRSGALAPDQCHIRRLHCAFMLITTWDHWGCTLP